MLWTSQFWLLRDGLKEGLKRVVSEVCGVDRSGRKPSDGGGQGFGGEGLEVAQFPTLDCFCKQRGARDGGGTATAEEAHIADRTAFDDGRELEKIAADGIVDLNTRVG